MRVKSAAWYTALRLGNSAFSTPCAAAATAEVKTKKVEYKHGETTFVGHLAWDDAVKGKRVVVVGPPSAPSRASAVPHVDALLAAIKRRALEHKYTPTIGRSHSGDIATSDAGRWPSLTSR